ncbi:hypothetical protein [Thermaurantiacus sp.]
MFRSLRPKPLEPLPLPFRDRKAERAAERRRHMERFANIEMDRATGFSWNRPRSQAPLAQRLRDALTKQLGAAIFAGLMGVAMVAAFLALSRAGLPDPPPRIIYVEDWSGRIEEGKPIPRVDGQEREASTREALARERAAARQATPDR